MKYSYPLFREQLEAIAAFTKLLNESNTDFPDDMYLKVELVMPDGAGGEIKFGSWSDEIASDCWQFEVEVP